LEEPLDDPATPLGGGYGESKWVGEQILYRASKTTPLRPIIVRVGQISGGINGAWHTTDWVPIIAKSSATLGCFPEMGGVCLVLTLIIVFITHRLFSVDVCMDSLGYSS